MAMITSSTQFRKRLNDWIWMYISNNTNQRPTVYLYIYFITDTLIVTIKI